MRSFFAYLKRVTALAVASAGLAACVTGWPPQSPVQFEVHAASQTASPGWKKSALIADPGTKVYIAPEVLLNNADIALAEAKKDPGGLALVVIQLTPAGTVRLEQASRALLGKNMAVTIDGEVLNAPVVAQPLSGNRLALAGFRSFEEAQRVARGIAPQK